jgi:hypothetical protein
MDIRHRDRWDRLVHRARHVTQRLICGGLLTLSLTALAGPLVLEPTATIPSPDARFDRVVDAAIDGDWLIMAALYNETLNPGGDYEHGVAAFLFKRDASGTWTYIRQLAEVITSGVDGYHPRPTSVAMNDGLAALNLAGRLFVFERSGTDWVEAQLATDGQLAVGDDTEIDDGTILVGESNCHWAAQAYRKNASGVYESVYLYEGVFNYCDENAMTGDIDISGATVILPQSYNEDDESFEPTISIWEGVPPSSAATNLAPPPSGDWAVGQSSVDGDTLVVSGGDPESHMVGGFHVYRRQSAGVWQFESSFGPPDALMSREIWDLQLEDGLLLVTRIGAVGGFNLEVFSIEDDGTIEYVAKLPDASRGHHDNGRIVGVSHDAVKVYEAETLSTPPQKRDDFQDGDAVGWVSQPGSDYQVVSTSSSNVYRQSSLTGNALSILSDTDWTDQSIQADVTPTAFDGNDRWFGLIARYTDVNNYYYVTARRSNVVQIRKIVNGAFQVLASAQLPIALNRTYRLRLEAVGDLLRLYVDGNPILETRDESHTHGQAGLMTYKTRADYDNVIVSPTPQLTLMESNFDVYTPGLWDFEGEDWESRNDQSAPTQLAQTSTSGTPRAIVGIPVADQSVQAWVKPTAFGSSAQGWFGLMARVVDSSNYYYVTVRRNNTISLRRLSDDVIHILDTGTFNVVVGTPYTLRLETIGSSIRAYVNGTLVLEATDSAIESGRYGFVTYSAAAEFDDLLVTQP